MGIQNLAKRAMTTKGQKACYVIDHLVQALGNEPSSSLRRALVLVDIDETPGTTQADIMNRLDIGKSAMNREVEWLFDYGCITRRDSVEDARTKTLNVCGYSKKELDAALGYFNEAENAGVSTHKSLKFFLERLIKIISVEKPSLRDAKIVSTLYEKGDADQQDVTQWLYNGPASTDNRAINKLIEEGIVANDEK
jgi:DNA-binding MarR family transcriptional regulator